MSQITEGAGVTGAAGGIIQNVGMVDLRGSSNEDIARIKLIENAGCILVAESRQGALANVAKKNVGVIIPIPDGAKIKLHVGQLKMSGEALEIADDPDALLIIVGQLLITSPLKKIGYKRVHIIGQVLAQRGSEDAIVRGVSNMIGQVIYYSGEARFFVGKESFGREFLEFSETPLTMILIGEYEFAPDVTVDVLKKRVAEIILIGMLKAPKALLPIVQFLCKEKHGIIGEAHA